MGLAAWYFRPAITLEQNACWLWRCHGTIVRMSLVLGEFGSCLAGGTRYNYSTKTNRLMFPKLGCRSNTAIAFQPTSCSNIMTCDSRYQVTRPLRSASRDLVAGPRFRSALRRHDVVPVPR